MKERGFTLMEMMIVVAIIMIISTAGLASFSFSRQKARDAQRKNDLGQIARALEVYANDFARYPLNDARGMIAGCGSEAASACAWGGKFSATYNGATQVYMTKLPADSAGKAQYYYQSDGNDFVLYSTLENNNDPDCRDDLGLVCGEMDCRYKLTNVGVEAGVGSGRCDTN